MVNIFVYLLVYYQNGNQVLVLRVIVGCFDCKMLMMSSVLNNVVVNLLWNVLFMFVCKDILLKVWNDSGYLECYGYIVMCGWNSKEVIDLWQVDWVIIMLLNFLFCFQQVSGVYNLLGCYKFNMLSLDVIYLYDMFNYNFFQCDVRVLSFGCVWVNKVFELVNMFLQDVGWNDVWILGVLK